MNSDHSPSRGEDIDLVTLGRAIWRAMGWIVGLTLFAGVITYIVLSMMRPVYTSEARILIENEESIYRRPAGDQSAPSAPALDEQAIQSQVQVLTSRDLILKVVQELDLTNNPSFAEDAGEGLIGRLKKQLGLTSQKSQTEEAAGVFAEHLTVYQRGKSSVIAVDYTSGDTELAAEAANSLSRAYIAWQRDAKLQQTRDATAWLNNQIEALRERVAESEAAVERFRAAEGIYAGSNNVDLTSQQLSELNSKLILAKAQKSEAEARARMIREMLAENGDIEATPEVLQSGLINALIEQRVQVQRQIAELSATLLPSHPRIRQLQSELQDVRRQIRDETRKIAQSLEREAQVADARVQSLAGGLNAAKSQASGESAAEIKLRALEREAKSNRDLLESYLARFRDASARGDVGAVPANATILSQAYPSLSPSFPKKLPITLLVMLAVALVILAYVMARELIRATAQSTGAFPRPAAGGGQSQPAAIAQEDRGELQRPPDPEAPNETGLTELRSAGNAESQVRSVQEVLSRFGRSETESGAETSHDADQDLQSYDTSGDSRQAASMPYPEEVETLPIPSRKARPAAVGLVDTGHAEGHDAADMSPLARYLRERSARNASKEEHEEIKREPAESDTNEVIRDFDILKDRLARKLGSQSAPVALLTPIAASNALPEALQLARPMAADGKTVLLLDIARGATTVSDFLGIRRSPGFNELLANEATFEDVLHVDRETPLQLIAAGDPDMPDHPGEVKSFVRILDALRQTYDSVLIHSDFPRAQHFSDALNGELTATIALFAPKTFTEDDSRLQILKELDCPLILYERRNAMDAGSGSLHERLAAR